MHQGATGEFAEAQLRGFLDWDPAARVRGAVGFVAQLAPEVRTAYRIRIVQPAAPVVDVVEHSVGDVEQALDLAR